MAPAILRAAILAGAGMVPGAIMNPYVRVAEMARQPGGAHQGVGALRRHAANLFLSGI
jgi:hypothetical protein